MAPPVSKAPVEMPNLALEDKHLALWTEVQSLVNMGAIEEVDPGTLERGGGLLPLLPGDQEDGRVPSHSPSQV